MFNKKNKDWPSEILANPPPPYDQEQLIFALPSPSPSQSGSHMSITPNSDYYNHWKACFHLKVKSV